MKSSLQEICSRKDGYRDMKLQKWTKIEKEQLIFAKKQMDAEKKNKSGGKKKTQEHPRQSEALNQ